MHALGVAPLVLLCGSDNARVARHAPLALGNVAHDDAHRAAIGLRGGKNEPCVMPAVARALAAALGDGAPSPEDVARATTAAAIEFFDLRAADERIARWRAECAAAGVTAPPAEEGDEDADDAPRPGSATLADG